MLNVFLIFLIILVNLLIFYCIYLDVSECMIRIKNEINNKSIKRKLKTPEELSHTFVNLGGE